MSSKPLAESNSFITREEFIQNYSAVFSYYFIENRDVVKRIKEVDQEKANLEKEEVEKYTSLFGITETIPLLNSDMLVHLLTEEEKQKPNFHKRWEVVKVRFQGADEVVNYYRPNPDTDEGQKLITEKDAFSVEAYHKNQEMLLKQQDALHFDNTIIFNSPSVPVPIHLPLRPEALIIGDDVVIRMINPNRLRYVEDRYSLTYLYSPILNEAVDKFEKGFALSTADLKLRPITEIEFEALKTAAVERENEQSLDDVLASTTHKSRPRRTPKTPKP